MFDLTKAWPHGDYPLIEVGVLELNRNPGNYFAEVGQVAMNPSNIGRCRAWRPIFAGPPWAGRYIPPCIN